MRRYKKVEQKCWSCSGSGKNWDKTKDCRYCEGTGNRKARRQIMRCWGGPDSGKSLTEQEAAPKGYIMYNPSSNRSKNPFPGVLIHKEVLEAYDDD